MVTDYNKLKISRYTVIIKNPFSPSLVFWKLEIESDSKRAS